MRPSDVDETLGGEPLSAAVAALALRKARAVAQAGALVLAADTVVALGSEVFGKPADAADARRMLERLRGRWHEVVTGLAVVADGREATAAVVTRVLMDDAADAWIAGYVARGEPLDKAGAYAIQGEGGRLITAVVGSYTNVVGLPLRETGALLGAFGVRVKRVAAG